MLNFCSGERVFGFQIHIVTENDKPNIIQRSLFQAILLKCQKAIATLFQTLKQFGIFIQREIKRGNKYDAIIMDPPSYGRGANGEVWKIENSIHDLVQKCTEVLSDNPLFFLINSYTTGLQPTVMENILRLSIGNKGKFDSYEVGLKTDEGIVLPCGCSALWTK